MKWAEGLNGKWLNGFGDWRIEDPAPNESKIRLLTDRRSGLRRIANPATAGQISCLRRIPAADE